MMRIALPVLLLVGCADEIANFPPPGDYTTWKTFDTWGDSPGHGDTFRRIYVNETAKLGVPYMEGTILVKEVYDRVDSGGEPGPGALRVIELSRRVGSETADQKGWVFSAASTPNGQETVEDFCWRRCHQAAPFDGAWFDYSK